MNQVLTEAEFDERFTLITFADDGQTTDDRSVMKQYPENQVWSLVDGDDGDLYLCSGFATVNFIAWQVTEEPHNAENYEITVELDD